MPHDRREISFRFLGVSYTFISDSGVFSKNELDEGTSLLLETVAGLPLSGSVCDLGSGIGIIGVLLKLRFPEVEMTAIEVNPRASALSTENAKRHKVAMQVFTQDGLTPENGCYDWIISNPPIRVGKEKLYALFSEMRAHCSEHGQVYLVIRKDQGALSAQRYLQSIFASCEIIARRKGFLILCCKRIDI